MRLQSLQMRISAILSISQKDIFSFFVIKIFSCHVSQMFGSVISVIKTGILLLANELSF